MEKRYTTDLSDAEWGRLELLVPAPNKRARPSASAEAFVYAAMIRLMVRRLARA